MRAILGEIKRLQNMDADELYSVAKEHHAPYELVEYCAAHGYPAAMASAIVRATTQYADPSIVAEVSFGLGDAMHGTEISELWRAGPAADAWLAGSAPR